MNYAYKKSSDSVDVEIGIVTYVYIYFFFVAIVNNKPIKEIGILDLFPSGFIANMNLIINNPQNPQIRFTIIDYQSKKRTTVAMILF